MSPPTSKSGQLWSNCLLDDSIDSLSSDVISTKLDPRKNNGLEARGSEQYLSQLLRKKKFVAPRVEKAKRENNRGVWRGRGRGFLKGRGRGRGAVNLSKVVEFTAEKMVEEEISTNKAQESDVAKGEEDLMLDLLAKMEQPKPPKTEEEIKKENVVILGGLFGGTLSRKERGLVKKKGLNRQFSTDTEKPDDDDDDAMDVEGQPPIETPKVKQTTTKGVEAVGKQSREIIDYGDLDYDF